MPLLSILTNATPSDAPTRERLFAHLTSVVSEALEKDRRWVMIAVSPRTEMSFAGSTAPTCYAELKNVGNLPAAEIERLSAVLCRELSGALAVPQDRVYIEFTNADGALWGWNGETFG